MHGQPVIQQNAHRTSTYNYTTTYDTDMII